MNRKEPSRLFEEKLTWLRDYIKTRLASVDLDEGSQLPLNVVLELGNQGLFGMETPIEFNGLAFSTQQSLAMIENVAAVDPTLAAYLVLHHTCSLSIIHHANRAFKEKYLPEMASGRCLACFGLSEFAAGSNPQGIQASLTQVSDKQWLLNGTKSWCGGSVWSGMIIAFARHSHGDQKGISAFALPSETKGITFGKALKTLGVNALGLRTIHFDHVTVGEEQLLGTLGAGMQVAQDSLSFGRLCTAAISLGVMKRSVQLMLRYASRRKISTGLLLESPVTVSKLKTADAAIFAIDALLLQLSNLRDEEAPIPDSALLSCKVVSSELSWDVTDQAVQMLGARGYVEANKVAKFLRDIRFLRVGEGPTETLLMQLGANLSSSSVDTMQFLREHLNDNASFEKLMSAIKAIQNCSPPDKSQRHLSLAQWEYFQIGKVGIWIFLEAALRSSTVQEMISNDYAAYHSSLVWVMRVFDETLSTVLQDKENPPFHSTIAEVSARIGTYKNDIGEIDDTVGVMQSQIDPMLRQSGGPQASLHQERELSAGDHHTRDESSGCDYFLSINLQPDHTVRMGRRREYTLQTSNSDISAIERIHQIALDNQLELEDLMLVFFSIFLSKISEQDALELLHVSSDSFPKSKTEAVQLIFPRNISLQGLLTQYKYLIQHSKRSWESPAEARVRIFSSNKQLQSSMNSMFVNGSTVCFSGHHQLSDDDLKGVDLCLMIEYTDHAINFKWNYDSSIFNQNTIIRRSENFRMLVTGELQLEQEALALSWLPEKERDLIVNVFPAIYGWSSVDEKNKPDHTIGKLIEDQVSVNRNAVAIITPNQSLTYGELNDRANQLACYLLKQNLSSESVVAISLGRTPNLIVSLLACVKIGAVFVPINHQHPVDRLQNILEQAGVHFLLVENHTRPQLTQCAAAVISLDQIKADCDKESNEPIQSSATTDEVAYIMFTSGSTGTPKGVELLHSGICSQLLARKNTFHLSADDRLLLTAAPNFDIAIWEFFGLLVTGGSIALSDETTLVWDANNIVDLCHSLQVTIVQAVPSQLHMILAIADNRLADQLKIVFVGGESLPNKLQKQFFDTLPNTQLINLYGPTEATIDSTYWFCSKDHQNSMAPIGYVLPNKKVYVLDPYMKPVPIGVTGELYIGGALAKGYLNDEERTQERFVKNPFAKSSNERLYKTGDRVRFQANGALEFFGRMDRQIKIRGVRLEPGEIESVLINKVKVKEIFVTVNQRRADDKEPVLIAYYTSHPGNPISEDHIRKMARQLLPSAIVPTTFVSLKSMPVTPTGKIDIKRLTSISNKDIEEKPKKQVKHNPVTKSVIDIWEECLNTRIEGVSKDFFDVGGHSLMAVQILMHIRELFDIKIPLKAFFENPTIDGLTALITNQRKRSVDVIQRAPIARDSAMPVSGTQKNLWWLAQLNPDSAAYNVVYAARLSGDLNRDCLQKSLDYLVDRHESLRSRFTSNSGEPELRLHTLECFPLNFVDLSQEQPEQQQYSWRSAIREASIKPFKLDSELLFQVSLFKLKDTEHVLFWNFHHIIADGVSTESLFIREWSEIYSALVNDRQPILADIVAQPVDYTQWFQDNYSRDQLEKQLLFWKQYLKGSSSSPCFPSDYERPAHSQHQGDYVRFRCRSDIHKKLVRFAKQENYTIYSVLLSAFYALAHLYSGEEDISIGTVTSGRNHSSVQSTIGNFANVVAIRVLLDDNPTLMQLLKRVHKRFLDVLDHADIPFESVVTALSPDRKSNSNPLFNLFFSLYNGDVSSMEFSGIDAQPISKAFYKSQSDYNISNGTSKFDLYLFIIENHLGLSGHLEFDSELYHKETIQAIVNQYFEVLEAIVETPTLALTELDVLSESEKIAVTPAGKLAQSKRAEPIALHRYFERQAKQYPSKMAVQYGQHQLTYASLNEKSNQLARYLKERGVTQNQPVGLCIDFSSLELIIGLLGIVKAGGAYVPIDAKLPASRIEYMLDVIDSELVVTQEKHLSLFASKQPICIDRDWTSIQGKATTNLDEPIVPDQLLYIMFTSGSTGNPKGVAVPHRGVARLANNADYMRTTPDDNVAQICNFSFDVSQIEIWGSLVQGASLIHIPDKVKLSASDLATFIHQNAIACVHIPTALFHQLVTEDPSIFASLKLLSVVGEALDPTKTRAVLKTGKPRYFLNSYGPTEASIYATEYDLGELSLDAQLVPIGKPIVDTQVYILNKEKKLVPRGAKGELYIAGPGLALAYYQRPDLTERSFINNPFPNPYDYQFLYRTGDMARIQHDGDLIYLGRADNQVKVRGFRIELDEIDKCLKNCDLVANSAVIVKSESDGNKMLVAFVVTVSTESTAVTHVIDYLHKKLPEYMVPSIVMPLAELPLSANGKIDRKQLQQIQLVQVQKQDHRMDPRNSLELRVQKLWEVITGIQQPSLNTPFFEAGGNSLKAIQFLSMIKQNFQKELPLSFLYENGTIESIASALQDDSSKNTSGSVVLRLNRQDEQPPLSIVHPISGSAMCYNPLASALDYPVIGIQSPSLELGITPFNSIESMASFYLKSLNSENIDVSFIVAGWSLGGMVAFEMVHQLELQGFAPKNLLLFDTVAPGVDLQEMSTEAILRLSIEEIVERFGLQTNELDFEIDPTLDFETQLNNLLERARSHGAFPPYTDITALRRMMEVCQVNAKALNSYDPDFKISTDITLVRASDTTHIESMLVDTQLAQQVDLGWSKWTTGEVSIIESEGKHMSMLFEPNLAALSLQIKAVIDHLSKDTSQQLPLQSNLGH